MSTPQEQLADILTRVRNISNIFNDPTPVDGLVAEDIHALSELALKPAGFYGTEVASIDDTAFVIEEGVTYVRVADPVEGGSIVLPAANAENRGRVVVIITSYTAFEEPGTVYLVAPEVGSDGAVLGTDYFPLAFPVGEYNEGAEYWLTLINSGDAELGHVPLSYISTYGNLSLPFQPSVNTPQVGDILRWNGESWSNVQPAPVDPRGMFTTPLHSSSATTFNLYEIAAEAGRSFAGMLTVSVRTRSPFDNYWQSAVAVYRIALAVALDGTQTLDLDLETSQYATTAGTLSIAVTATPVVDPLTGTVTLAVVITNSQHAFGTYYDVGARLDAPSQISYNPGVTIL